MAVLKQEDLELEILPFGYIDWKSFPEFDYKVLVMFPSTLERSKLFNSRRPDECRVPEDVIEMMFKKFEQPSEEVLALVDEVDEVRW